MYPLVWLDDVSMTSPALPNDVDKHHLDCYQFGGIFIAKQ
jgi:hypothetical protein